MRLHRFIYPALCLGAFVVTAGTALAHHSFSAEFDSAKTINLTGKVVKVEWMNPHIWVYLDVTNGQGKVERWQCEGGAPNSLTRSGLSKDNLKEGDKITIDGSLAKDGTKTCNARSVKLPDGRNAFAGSSGGDVAPANAVTTTVGQN